VQEALHIGVDEIKAHNPNIIYVRGSGYGTFGPDADRGGYDILGYWSRSGLAYGATPPDLDGIISQPGPAYGDSIGAMTIAGGISAALLHRERTGEAPVVDVSLLATGMWAMGAGIALSLQLGFPWRHPPVVREEIWNPLANVYRTKDDRWLYLSCLQGFEYWPDVCRVVDRPDLIEDARFLTHELLTANAREAAHLLEAEFLSRPLGEWRERFDGFRGQWSPVQDCIEATSDPQVEANGYLVEAETKEGVSFKLVATPVQFDERPSVPTRAPEFNEQGDDILTQLLGIGWDDVVDMKVKGIVA
jgi:crotonobetainyl-CoA:carnitine CoA-transferase CaiB-like acyl-CoA transferase